MHIIQRMNQSAQNSANWLARLVLAAFIITFAICRLMVYMIMSHKAPNLYLHVGQAHVHHAHYGIFVLCGVGAYMLFCRPTGNLLALCAALYGVGLGLLFDEYGMLINMSGSYWQPASVVAVMMVAAALSVIIAAPSLSRLRTPQWVGAAVAILLLTSFGKLLARPVHRVEKQCMSRLIQIERTT